MSNRSLVSMNWQEASNGMWYAETTNYRCVAYERTPEEIAALPSFANDYPCNVIVYEWNETEKSWIHLAANMWGVKGSLTDAMLEAERSLGQQIKQKERRIDPGTQLYDNVNRLLENFQMRAMEAARMQEDPRMRGLPPGHPPIRRRGDRDMFDSIGRTTERFLEQRMMPPPSMQFTQFPTLSDIGPVGKSPQEMEADLKKHLDEKFPDRNKGK